VSLGSVHAVVTGGGTGIGAAIAHVLSAEGARVTVIGRRMAPLETVAHAIGGLPLCADAADRTALCAALAAAREHYGPVAIAVANAGQALTAPFDRIGQDQWRAMFVANVETSFNLAQATLGDLRAAPAGRFVAIASTAALTGYAYASAYAAAKHAVVGMVRSLAREVARTPMTVNAVCPGFTDTPIADEAIENIAAKTGRSSEQALAELAKFNPQRRLVEPAEVAATVAWLCSPDSGSITGQAISVSGGETM